MRVITCPSHCRIAALTRARAARASHERSTHAYDGTTTVVAAAMVAAAVAASAAAALAHVVRPAPPRCGVPPYLWRVDVVRA